MSLRVSGSQLDRLLVHTLGAIQFTAGMDQAEHIIAVNSDKDAPIFKLAHVCIVSDLYEVLPQMISKLKENEA